MSSPAPGSRSVHSRSRSPARQPARLTRSKGGTERRSERRCFPPKSWPERAAPNQPRAATRPKNPALAPIRDRRTRCRVHRPPLLRTRAVRLQEVRAPGRVPAVRIPAARTLAARAPDRVPAARTPAARVPVARAPVTRPELARVAAGRVVPAEAADPEVATGPEVAAEGPDRFDREIRIGSRGTSRRCGVVHPRCRRAATNPGGAAPWSRRPIDGVARLVWTDPKRSAPRRT
jgi:hypothetical protein